MDKSERRAIMAKFLNKGKSPKPNNPANPPKPIKPPKPTTNISSPKPTKPPKPPKSTTSVSTQKATPPTDQDSGFYETLIMKQKPNVQQSTKKDAEICKKLGSINNLIKKKYMIPSQFPNITQAHSN